MVRALHVKPAFTATAVAALLAAVPTPDAWAYDLPALSLSKAPPAIIRASPLPAKLAWATATLDALERPGGYVEELRGLQVTALRGLVRERRAARAKGQSRAGRASRASRMD